MDGTQGGRAMATGSAPLPPGCSCCGCSLIDSSFPEEEEGSEAAAALAARVRRGPAAAAAAAAMAQAALRRDSNATRTCEETEGTAALAPLRGAGMLQREKGDFISNAVQALNPHEQNLHQAQTPHAQKPADTEAPPGTEA